MSEQAVNTRATDPKDAGTPYADVRRLLGELVVGIRVDALPAGEAGRLAADGKFHPLTLDANGCLRVVFPDGAKVETDELAALRDIRALLTETRDLLLKIA